MTWKAAKNHRVNLQLCTIYHHWVVGIQDYGHLVYHYFGITTIYNLHIWSFVFLQPPPFGPQNTHGKMKVLSPKNRGHKGHKALKMKETWVRMDNLDIPLEVRING